MKESFLNRAKENLESAELLFQNCKYNASANRAYYAAIHAATFYLMDNKYEFKIDHQIVLSLFSNEFINRKKVFPSKLKQYLYDMQSTRNIADYQSGISKKVAAFQLKMSNYFIKTVINEE